MRTVRSAEARAAALFMDTLPEETRAYLLDMIYRVAGVEPPTPLVVCPPPSSEKVIRLTNVLPLSRCS